MGDLPTSKTKREVLDELRMSQAIGLARQAEREGLRPFGCVITNRHDRPLAMSYGSEASDDPTRHSEILGIRSACQRLGRLLHGCTIYSTHEPCTMCCGAICHAKLTRVVFGSYRRDLEDLFREKQYNSLALLADTTTPVQVVGGILRAECIALFDRERRAAETAEELALAANDMDCYGSLPT